MFTKKPAKFENFIMCIEQSSSCKRINFDCRVSICWLAFKVEEPQKNKFRGKWRKGDNFLAWDERKMQGSNAAVAALNLTPTSHIRNDAKETG